MARCAGAVLMVVLALLIASCGPAATSAPAPTTAPAAAATSAPLLTVAPAAPTVAPTATTASLLTAVPATPTAIPALTIAPVAQASPTLKAETPAVQTAIATVGPATLPSVVPLPSPTPTGSVVPASAASAGSSPLTVAYPALPKSMTVGDASVEHRPSVAPGESTFVRLTVTGAAELSALKTQPVAHNSPSDPGFVYKLSPQIDLYP